MRNTILAKASWPLALGLCLAVVEASAAPQFHVDVTHDAPDAVPGDGFCSITVDPNAQEHVCSLRAAVMEINAKPFPPNERAVIQLEVDEVYTLGIPRSPVPGNDDSTGDLDLRRRTYIGVQASATGRAVIDGAGADRVFTFLGGAAGSELNGIEIRNARGQQSAASAIYVLNTSVTLRNLDIHTNSQTGAVGCAVRSVSSGLQLIDTTIRDNLDTGNGMRGLCVQGTGAAVDIVGSAIYRNPGPAIHASAGATVIATSTTLSTAVGHVLLLQEASLDMQFSTVVAEPGGGVLRLTVADQHDVQISIYASALSRSSSSTPAPTVCDLDIQGTAQVSTAWNVVPNVICKLDPSDASSAVISAIGLSPLADAGGRTLSYAPVSDSVLVDRAPAGVCFGVTTDQRGKPRPVGHIDIADPRCDIGAIELDPQAAIFADGFE